MITPGWTIRLSAGPCVVVWTISYCGCCLNIHPFGNGAVEYAPQGHGISINRMASSANFSASVTTVLRDCALQINGSCGIVHLICKMPSASCSIKSTVHSRTSATPHSFARACLLSGYQPVGLGRRLGMLGPYLLPPCHLGAGLF